MALNGSGSPSPSPLAVVVSLLRSLPLRDKKDLLACLHQVYTNQHQYSLKASCGGLDLLQNLVSAVRIYECNGLQLCGYACWLLSELIHGSGASVIEALATSETMETLIRVGLEHPVHSYCFTTLGLLVKDSAERFSLMCDTGLSIEEELPLHISSENLYPLLCITCRALQTHSQLQVKLRGLKLLGVLLSRVAKDSKAQYFLPKHLPSIMRCLTAGLSSDGLGLGSGVGQDVAATAMRTLTYLSNISPRHALEIGTTQSFEILRTLFTSQLTVQTKAELYRLLTSLSRNRQLRETVRQIVPLRQVANSTQDDYMLVEPAVRILANITQASAAEDLITVVCDNITDTFVTVLDELTAQPLAPEEDDDPLSLGANGETVKKYRALPEVLLKLKSACRALKIVCVEWEAIKCDACRLRMSEMRKPLLCLFKMYFNGEDLRLSAHGSLFDALALACDSKNLSDKDFDELIGYKFSLERFVEKWDEYVPVKLNKCIACQFVLTRIFGAGSIIDINPPGPLMEILHEILTDERHGVSEEEGMCVKLVQILSSITRNLSSNIPGKCSLLDDVVDKLSETQYGGDVVFTFVTVELLSAACNDDITKRHVCTMFPKIEATLDCFSLENFFLSEVLAMLYKVCGFVHKLDWPGEILLANWIAKGLQNSDLNIVAASASIITRLGNNHGYFVNKNLSRPEIEETILELLYKYGSRPTITRTCVRALVVLIRNYNPKVPYAVEPWTYHWTYTRRFILQSETSSFLLNLVHKNFGHRQIMASVLGYGASLYKCVGESRKMEVVSNFSPLFPHAFRQLTHGEHVLSHTSDLERPSTLTLADKDMVPIGGVDETFELLAFHTLEALLVFLGDNPTGTFQRFEIFNTLSVCESVSQVIIACPESPAVHRMGIEVLFLLASYGIDTALFGQLAAKALTIAIMGAPQDKDVHLRFVMTVKILAKNSTAHRHTLVASGAHKWLYIVLQCNWPDVTVHALEAVANLCLDPDIAKVIGTEGLLEAVLRTLEHQTDPKAFLFGCHALAVMCRVPEVTAMCRTKKMEKLLKKAKKMQDSSPELELSLDEQQQRRDVEAALQTLQVCRLS